MKLQKDPLFAAELNELQDSVKSQLLDRLTAMEQLEQASQAAVDVCLGAISGDVDGEKVDVKTRINTAFDLLNRIGVNRSKKQITNANETMADMIIDAYNRGQSDRDSGGDSGHGTKKAESLDEKLLGGPERSLNEL